MSKDLKVLLCVFYPQIFEGGGLIMPTGQKYAQICSERSGSHILIYKY